MRLAEAFRFSAMALASNKTRTFLTALGLVIGNASVILVVTISLTSRELILEQIRDAARKYLPLTDYARIAFVPGKSR